jgi:hypothetical protein
MCDINPFPVLGVGQQQVTHKATHPLFGDVFCLPGFGTNLLSYGLLLQRGYAIDWNTTLKVFTATKDDSMHVFHMVNLLPCLTHTVLLGVPARYAKPPPVKPLSAFSAHLGLSKRLFPAQLKPRAFPTLVEKKLSPGDNKRADMAKLQHLSLAHPSSKVQARCATNNVFDNNPVTPRDVSLKDRKYGPCIDCVKGKITAGSGFTLYPLQPTLPVPFQPSNDEPYAYEPGCLNVDIMYVRGPSAPDAATFRTHIDAAAAAENENLAADAVPALLINAARKAQSKAKKPSATSGGDADVTQASGTDTAKPSVAQVPVLIATDSYSGYTWSVVLAGGKATAELEPALNGIIANAARHGHIVKSIRMDQEACFRSLSHTPLATTVNLSFCAQNKHVHRAERKIRQTKERIRAVIQHLPYVLPLMLYPYLVRWVVACINFVPTTTSPSSPHVAFTGTRIDASKWLTHSFGDFVLVREPYPEKHPDNEARAWLGIIVGRDMETTGNFYVYLLESKRILSRQKLIKIMLTDAHVAMINKMSEGIPTPKTEQLLDLFNEPLQPYLPPAPVTAAVINTAMVPDIRSPNPLDRMFFIDQGEEGTLVLACRGASNAQLTAQEAEATVAELKQLHDRHVWHPVHASSLTTQEKQDTLPSHVLTRHKYTPVGPDEEKLYDKTKARLVVNGALEKLSPFEDVASATVQTDALSLVLATIAFEEFPAETNDIPGAFLNATLPKERVIHVRIGKKHADALALIDPAYKTYQRQDGSLVVRLVKALYGLKESPLLWNIHITDTLLTIGYRRSSYDKCVFYHTDEGTNKLDSIIALHVDDLVRGSNNSALDAHYHAVLTQTYGAYTKHAGDDLAYVGMRIRFNRENKSVTCYQTTQIKDIAKKYGITGKASTPAAESIKENAEASTSPYLYDTTLYRSALMSVMYVATHTRPDVLYATTTLAKHSQAPRQTHLDALHRLIRYLLSTSDLGLTLAPTSMQLYAMADASLSHDDHHGHTGYFLSLGSTTSAPFRVKSNKQKSVATSSTHAELLALYEVMFDVMWAKRFLTEIGYKQDTITVFHDNKPAIQKTAQAQGTKGKLRWLDKRYAFISERVEKKHVKIVHMPTDNMTADILTKPLYGEQFTRMRAQLLNIA